MKRRAVFLDRDGTLVHAAHYPSRPQDLHLYDNIGPGLRALEDLGFCLVVITNQAGIARGYFTEVDLQRMHVYLRAKLALWGVRLDGIYYCPHHSEGVVPELAVSCACRKPRPGMLLQAARDLDLDLRRSWFVGDILDDVEAGNRAGCRTILVDLGTESAPEHFLRSPAFVARDTRHALEIIKTVTMLEPDLDLAYRPAAWRTYDSEHWQSHPERPACHREHSEGSSSTKAERVMEQGRECCSTGRKDIARPETRARPAGGRILSAAKDDMPETPDERGSAQDDMGSVTRAPTRRFLDD